MKDDCLHDQEGTSRSSKGHKADADKLRMDLIPVEALDAMARRLTLGSQRYGARNWEKGIVYSRLYAALLRHLLAWWGGQDMDSDPAAGDSSHLEGVLINAAFLVALEKRGIPGLDDRPVR